MKITAKQITTTAVLLAICIASQFVKNMNVYITGTIVNLCLILATLFVGTLSGVILSIITPVTAFFITGAPVIAAVPIIMPMIMIGNAILVITIGLLKDKIKYRVIIPMLIGSVLKTAFMGYFIGYVILPKYLPAAMMGKIAVFQWTYSGVQFITALSASIITSLIWMPIYRIKTRMPSSRKTGALLDAIYGPEDGSKNDDGKTDNNSANKETENNN